MSKGLVSHETMQGVLEDYRSGKKIHEIERDRRVSRSTLYWILQENGVAPSRAQRGARLQGNTEQLALLYELIKDQQQRIDKMAEIIGAIRAAGSAPKQIGDGAPAATEDAFAKARVALLLREYDAQSRDEEFTEGGPQ